jgi:hypothetical protein
MPPVICFGELPVESFNPSSEHLTARQQAGKTGIAKKLVNLNHEACLEKERRDGMYQHLLVSLGQPQSIIHMPSRTTPFDPSQRNHKAVRETIGVFPDLCRGIFPELASGWAHCSEVHLTTPNRNGGAVVP